MLKKYPTCWLAIPGVCTGASQEVHHRWPVAAGGTNDLYLPSGEAQLVGVCRKCHARVSVADSAPNGTRVLREPEPHPGVIR